MLSIWCSKSSFAILLLGTHAYAQFNLKDNYVGKDFLSNFQWFTADDPTHGRVNYVDQPTSLQKNLSYASDKAFVMRADSTTNAAASARGRDSVRITSQKSYTDSVIVFDLAHMPEGCGTWPAAWTVTTGQWPNGGEIDVVEGANTVTANLASLHTTAGCTMPQTRSQTGKPTSLDCNAALANNQGCGNTFTKANSYGAGFNSVGGGWYVLKRTNQDGAYIWFWARNEANVPDAVKNGGNTINPDASWGEPEARFPTDSCNWPQHFGPHSIVFDLTFCGDWAGSTFGSSPGCSGDCVSFVNNNPSAFSNAYWEVNAVRVYTS